MSTTATTYEVHLADVPNTPKHVSTDTIQYYDSGIWVETDAGRTFFPWERVTMIRENAAEPGTDGTGTEEPEPTEVAADTQTEEPSGG